MEEAELRTQAMVSETSQGHEKGREGIGGVEEPDGVPTELLTVWLCSCRCATSWSISVTKSCNTGWSPWQPLRSVMWTSCRATSGVAMASS